MKTKPQKTLSPDQIAEVSGQMAPYGYTLTADADSYRIATPAGKVTGVWLEPKKGGYRAVSPHTGKLWSGPDVSRFLADFWYANKI